jgi:hypothetical protein
LRQNCYISPNWRRKSDFFNYIYRKISNKI